MKLLIGLTAKPGGGKGTFVRSLKEVCKKNGFFPSIGGPRFSDALFETANLFGILTSRENLQRLAQYLDELCPGAMAKAMRNKLEGDLNEIKIADGCRWHYDEKMIRELAGVMVYVNTDQKLRYERIKARKEKAGDAEKTWEKFLAEDSAKNELYVEEIGSRADFKIDNNGTLEDYQRQVEEFYQKFIASSREKNTPH